MGKLYVTNGTPVGDTHLCKHCNWGQYMTGYRETEVLVICTNSNPARAVPFVVHQCTEYQDRNRPDFDQMEKLAINFHVNGHRNPTPGFRGSGFATVPVIVDDEDEGEDEVARLF
jgi:hypothetical protein